MIVTCPVLYKGAVFGICAPTKANADLVNEGRLLETCSLVMNVALESAVKFPTSTTRPDDEDDSQGSAVAARVRGSDAHGGEDDLVIFAPRTFTWTNRTADRTMCRITSGWQYGP